MFEGFIALTFSGAANSKFKALFSVWLTDFRYQNKIVIQVIQLLEYFSISTFQFDFFMLSSNCIILIPC